MARRTVVLGVCLAVVAAVAAAAATAVAGSSPPERPIAHVCSLLTGRQIGSTLARHYRLARGVSGWTSGPSSSIADHNVLHSIDPAYVLLDSATCTWSGGTNAVGAGVQVLYIVDVYAVPVRENVVAAGDKRIAHEFHDAPWRFKRVPGIGTWTGYTYDQALHRAAMRIIIGHDVILMSDQNSAQTPHRRKDVRLARALAEHL